MYGGERVAAQETMPPGHNPKKKKIDRTYYIDSKSNDQRLMQIQNFEGLSI